ncbi:MAG: haloacid dehalogenase-like hydrolase [Candidatus Aenigmatarchaeota archaeon]
MMTDDMLVNGSKDLIIRALATEWPLSVQQLYQRTLKHRPSISYHAVHKACRQLAARGVLKREGKAYVLSDDWLGRLCEFADKVKAGYAGKTTIMLLRLKDFHEGDSRSFTFENLEEAENYRKRLQWEYLVAEGKKEPYCGMSRHLRSPLFASERSLNIMNMATKTKSEAFMLVAGDEPIDRWCADYYRNRFVRVQTGVPCAETCDTMVLGDVVVQLHLPETLRTKLELLYLNTKNVAELSVADLYNSVYKQPADVKISVMRNSEIARQLRERIMSHFKFSEFAVFSVNGTLVDEFLVKIFAEYLALNGKFDKKAWQEIEILGTAHKKGSITYDRYVAKVVELYADGLKGQMVEDVKALARSFVEEGRVPVFGRSKRLFNWTNSYYRTLAITKNTEEITEALKDIFAFDDVLASQLEIKNGRYTGKVKRSLASGEAKLKAFREWLKGTGMSLKGSVGFGNLADDFLFLEQVERPILLSAEPKCVAFARKRKWLVFDQRTDAVRIIDELEK